MTDASDGALLGKVAVVTGAGRHRGIGRYIALTLAQHGADVAITGSGRSKDQYSADETALGWHDVDSVAEEIRALGRRALPLVVDVGQQSSVERLIAEACNQLGGIDILVNNAAAGRGADRVPIVDLEESEWRRVVDVNLTGAFLVTRSVARIMIAQERGGKIINISSVAGRKGIANTGVYAATKAGLILFTQVLAAELAQHEINVNCVCPGLIDTFRMESAVHGKRAEQNLSTIPLRRAGHPSEVGELIAFLSSAKADYIHGQTINIDGGADMR